MRASVPTPHADHVAALWSRLARRAGGVPARRDLAPASLAAALPWSVLVDRIAPEATRMRLGGAHLGSLLGTDPAGVPLSALMDADSRGELAAAMACLFGRPAPVTLDVAIPRSAFRSSETGTLSLWPLTDPIGALTRAVAVLDLPQPPTRSARLRVTGWRAAAALFAAPTVSPASAAEPPRPFLRLVVSND